MQETRKQPVAASTLLTAGGVGRLLGVDPTTIYRMAADGRLSAVKVGKQWRFRAEDVAAAFPGAASVLPPSSAPMTPALPTLPVGLAAALTELTARSLGVMMVVTDMAGAPVTPVANPCDWYLGHADDQGVVEACVTEWRTLAEDLDLTPHFVTGPMGFDCARAFVRRDNHLVGMVLAGGIAPRGSTGTDGLFDLDEAGRNAVIDTLPRVASALARATDDTVERGTPS